MIGANLIMGDGDGYGYGYEADAWEGKGYSCIERAHMVKLLSIEERM